MVRTNGLFRRLLELAGYQRMGYHLGGSANPMRTVFIEFGRATLNVSQFSDHYIQSGPLDELHHVIWDALVLARPEDRHNVGVMQSGRRLGLPLEPLDLVCLPD